MKILLILIVVAVVIMLFLRKSPARTATKVRAKPVKKTAQQQRGRVGITPAPEKSPYRCTSIKMGKDACNAAREREGKRYLHSEVPSLPLGACDVAKCDCRYLHHDDRRDSDEDRRAIAGLNAELYADYGNTERRDDPKGRGRRKSDKRA